MSSCAPSTSPNRPPSISRSRCPRFRPIRNDPASRCWRCSHPSRVRSRCGRSPARRSHSCSRSSGRSWRSPRCSTPGARGAPDADGPVPSVPGCSMSCVPRSTCVMRPSVRPHGGGRHHRPASSSARSSCLAARAPSGHRHRQRCRGAAVVRVDGTPGRPRRAAVARARRMARAGARARRPLRGHRLRRRRSRSPGRPPGRRSCSARTTGFPVGWRSSFPAHALAVGRSVAAHGSGGGAAASARPCRRPGLAGRRCRCAEDGRPRVAERLGQGRDDRGRRR